MIDQVSSEEKAVKDAASALAKAIGEAKAKGYVIGWPARADGLSEITVSAGRKALTPEEVGQAAKAAAEREQATEGQKVTTLRVGVDSSRVEDAVRQIQNASASADKTGKAVDQPK